MHRQTIGLSMTRRKNLPILKISPNLALFSPVSGLLDVNREHRSMRFRNEANVEYMSVCQHCAHGEGNGTQLQYSCLENPMDRGAWRATIHRISKSQTQLKRLSMRNLACIHHINEGLRVREVKNLLLGLQPVL